MLCCCAATIGLAGSDCWMRLSTGLCEFVGADGAHVLHQWPASALRVGTISGNAAAGNSHPVWFEVCTCSMPRIPESAYYTRNLLHCQPFTPESARCTRNLLAFLLAFISTTPSLGFKQRTFLIFVARPSAMLHNHQAWSQSQQQWERFGLLTRNQSDKLESTLRSVVSAGQ